jgi:hypothetical protein
MKIKNYLKDTKEFLKTKRPYWSFFNTNINELLRKKLTLINSTIASTQSYFNYFCYKLLQKLRIF